MQVFWAVILSAMLWSAVVAPSLAQAVEREATVLITGANRGIGLALSQAFQSGGYKVIGTARDPDRAEQLSELGVRVEQLDVTSSASVVELRESLQGVAIDILINNAGITGDTSRSLENLDIEDVARVLDVNTLGPLRVTQALLPNVLASQRKTVINMSSMMGSHELNTWGCCLGYRASKAALNSMNTTLSVEYAKQDMVFVVLHPGYVQTDMNKGKGDISSRESGESLFRVIDGITTADNGKFYDYQGKLLPW